MNKDSKNHFKFGENWAKFIENSMDEEREKIACEYTMSFLGKSSLKGKTVLDIGAGSGMFSLIFFKAGADKITCFDYDQKAVECALKLRNKVSKPKNWEVLQGDVLNDNFIKSLGTFDLVYSWGVLHHTGNMWKALENAAKCVNEHGSIYIAIYNRSPGRGINSSIFWEKEKIFFNSMPIFLQKLMIYCYIINQIFNMLVRGINPIQVIKNHKSCRGMSWYRDIVDWLGGFPYEYASLEEIFKFFYQRNFELINIKTTLPLCCNEFLFRKK